MFWKDLVKATELIERYGLRGKLNDIGGEPQPCIADYDLTIATGDQDARYVTLTGRPFDHIDPSYLIVPFSIPTQVGGGDGANPVTKFLELNSGKLQTVVCIGVLERVVDPAGFFKLVRESLAKDSLFVITAAFAYPFAPNSGDLWRFSADGLAELARSVGLEVLEVGWSLTLDSSNGILTSEGKPQEVRSAYLAAASSDFKPRSGQRYKLPERVSSNLKVSAILRATPTFSGGSCESVAGAPRPSSAQTEVSRVDSTPAASGQKCLFINTFYPAFMEDLYRRDPSLAGRSYAEQLAKLNGTGFGDSDFYSAGLARAGWITEDLIINCAPLQSAWAREHMLDLQPSLELVVEQVKATRPDVTYIQDMHCLGQEFLAAIRPFTGLIVGQIASQYSAEVPIRSYDLIISSFPHFVERFRSLGITSIYQPLSFSQRVLAISKPPSFNDRQIELSFVGGVTPEHQARFALLEYLARETPLKYWGYGAESLPQDSQLRSRYQGAAWGSTMFGVLGNSKLTINIHSEAAESNANNMRLFEATGFGALLITDYKDNLNELFEIGKEVVAFRSKEECAALVNYYLANPSEAAAIALAGQARTFRDYSYDLRMKETAELLARQLRYRREANRYKMPDLRGVSTGYQGHKGSIGQKLTEAWKDSSIPVQQRGLVQSELTAMYKGAPPEVFSSLAKLLKGRVRVGAKVLEAGCSSGYYYEVLEYLLSRKIKYTGLDYSKAMVEMARDFYPSATFIEGDACELPFDGGEFDLAISGCVILHLVDYKKHISEISRVSSNYVVYHRTPISRQAPTQTFTKLAYGVETVELRFNEREFLDLCSKSGLELLKAVEVSAAPAQDEYTVSHLFKRI